MLWVVLQPALEMHRQYCIVLLCKQLRAEASSEGATGLGDAQIALQRSTMQCKLRRGNWACFTVYLI